MFLSVMNKCNNGLPNESYPTSPSSIREVAKVRKKTCFISQPRVNERLKSLGTMSHQSIFK